MLTCNFYIQQARKPAVSKSLSASACHASQSVTGVAVPDIGTTAGSGSVAGVSDPHLPLSPKRVNWQLEKAQVARNRVISNTYPDAR